MLLAAGHGDSCHIQIFVSQCGLRLSHNYHAVTFGLAHTAAMSLCTVCHVQALAAMAAGQQQQLMPQQQSELAEMAGPVQGAGMDGGAGSRQRSPANGSQAAPQPGRPMESPSVAEGHRPVSPRAARGAVDVRQARGAPKAPSVSRCAPAYPLLYGSLPPISQHLQLIARHADAPHVWSCMTIMLSPTSAPALYR